MTDPNTYPDGYEYEYDEQLSADGSVKHTYVPPQDPSHAPVYDIIQNHLDTYTDNNSTTVLILNDLLHETSITITCQPTDDISGILTAIITKEKSSLYFLHSIPTANALIAGLELHQGSLSPEYRYIVKGNKIEKIP